MASSKKSASTPKQPLRDPRSGRFIKATPKALRDLAKAVARDYRRAVQERNQAAKRRRKGAKLETTQKKHDKAYRDAAKKVVVRERQLLKVQAQLPAPRAKSLPKVMEVGLNYSAARGIAGDVNVNIRIKRVDGRGVSEADVHRALFALGSGEASLPSDLSISGVEWQRPQRTNRNGVANWRHGEAGDAWNFHSIISTLLFPSNRGADYSAFRIGHVKEDVL